MFGSGYKYPRKSRMDGQPMRVTTTAVIVSLTLTGGVCAVAMAARAVAPVANESSRFFPLGDITTANVATLERAWTYHSGDFSGGRGPDPGRQVPGVQV